MDPSGFHGEVSFVWLFFFLVAKRRIALKTKGEEHAVEGEPLILHSKTVIIQQHINVHRRTIGNNKITIQIRAFPHKSVRTFISFTKVMTYPHLRNPVEEGLAIQNERCMCGLF